MNSIADSAVTIQTSSESVSSTPCWLGEVALLVHHLQQQGVLSALSGMWAEDTWQLESINEKGDPVQRALCFTFASASLKNEFKYAVW